jgi:glycosyltransferase involved in cell wall biosynthesis
VPPRDDVNLPEAATRIRVLLAIKGLGHGGAERLLVDTVAHGDLGAFQYEVAYVLDRADDFAPALAGTGTPVHNLGARHNLDPRWLRAFRRLLLSGEYDIVHFHLPYTAALGRLVIRTLPPDRRPVTAYTEHSLWNKVAVLIKALNRITIGSDGALIAVSGAAYEALPRALQRRARVVVHGVDRAPTASLVERRAEVRRDIRAELDVPQGDLLVVTVANMRSEKGYDVLLETASLAGRRDLPVRFAAAGTGALEAELSARHRELALGDRFRFLGHRRDAVELLTAADIVVLPSHQEGLPVVLMEATGVGATILATSVGGVTQMIEHGTNGIIVPPGRPDLMIEALETLCADADLRSRLGEQALAGSVEFDVARSSREIEAIYRRLAGGSPEAGVEP